MKNNLQQEDRGEEHVHYHGVDKAEEHIKVDQAIEMILRHVSSVGSETLDLSKALERVLFKDIISGENIPELARSTRDGFAVRMPSEDSPRVFRIVGEVRIGVIPKGIPLRKGEAVRIATGSYVPRGTDAVVMKEYAKVEGSTLSVDRPLKSDENILRPGEDILKGTVLLKRGTRLKPQHMALLSILGVERVSVFRKPRIAFFSTGDELVDSKSSKKQGIYDATRPFIGSMLSQLLTEPCDLGIASDNLREIRSKMYHGLISFDGLILSAGSSVGDRDYVAQAADSINGVKILVHGVAMRPSSPTGLALYRGRKPFILLPGFPTSAIVSFFVFALPIISKLSGQSGRVLSSVRAEIADDYQGKLGIKHFLRVRVSEDLKAHIVKPTEAYFSRWIAEANGIAIVDENRGPLKKGDEVEVLMIGNF